MTLQLLSHHLNLMEVEDFKDYDLQKVMVLKYLKIVGNMFLVIKLTLCKLEVLMVKVKQADILVGELKLIQLLVNQCLLLSQKLLHLKNYLQSLNKLLLLLDICICLWMSQNLRSKCKLILDLLNRI